MTKIIEPEKDAAGARRKTRDEAQVSSLWEEIDEIMSGVPDEALRRLPADGAEQHDHYLYGSPKRALQDT